MSRTRLAITGMKSRYQLRRRLFLIRAMYVRVLFTFVAQIWSCRLADGKFWVTTKCQTWQLVYDWADCKIILQSFTSTQSNLLPVIVRLVEPLVRQSLLQLVYNPQKYGLGFSNIIISRHFIHDCTCNRPCINIWLWLQKVKSPSPQITSRFPSTLEVWILVGTGLPEAGTERDKTRSISFIQGRGIRGKTFYKKYRIQQLFC